MSDDNSILDPMNSAESEGEMGTDEGMGVEKKPEGEEGEEGEGSTMPEGEEEAAE